MGAIRVIPFLQWWQIAIIIAVIIMFILIIKLLTNIRNILRGIYRIEKVKGLEAGYIIEGANLFKDWRFADDDTAIRKEKPMGK